MADRKLELQVRSLASIVCTITARIDWSVRDVKRAIQEAAQIPATEQRLVCGSTEMVNWERLSTYASKDQASLGVTLLRVEKSRNELWVGRVTNSKNDGMRLQFAPEHVKNDRMVVLAAVQNYPRAIQYAGERVRQDKEVFLAAVKSEGVLLRLAPARLREDRQLVMAAVKQSGVALQYAHASLKADVDVVIAALGNDPDALRFAPVEVQLRPEVVAAMERKNAMNAQFLEMQKSSRSRPLWLCCLCGCLSGGS
mmetsp:Transcript_49100/g.78199  ORF Transcript_49100/g.78199 Transcript_49100/m.78199 type:complete len:254 (+) Transcript_49100:32-793(+)